jgi:hypothetical protein
MTRLEIHPYCENDSPLPQSDRVVFADLLSRIIDELPQTRQTWVATLALGLPRAAGMTVRDMAFHARCTEAVLITEAIRFAAGIGIKASPHLRSAVRTHMASGQITIKGALPGIEADDAPRGTPEAMAGQ